MKTIFLAAVVPSALPALRVAGALFLIVNLLAGAWAWRHRRQLFGPDSTVTGDRPAIRQLQAIVLGIPWLFLTFRLLFIMGRTLDCLTTFKVSHCHEIAQMPQLHG